MAEEKIEYIGKIKLDLTLYPGEDLYCDGDVEDRLLQITRDYAAVEYQKIIEESGSWPILYHLSSLRENIVDWLPISKDMKVLEVGAGCGAITGALARKAESVTCIDLSKKRSMINAYRHMELDNVTIKVGNFMDIEQTLDRDFDMICLIGVFEYGQLYTGGETPYEDLLNIIKSHCKPTGNIVIAIESKFGLKYWAGCKEDHLGTYFSGLEDYPEGGPVRTFTADGLKKIAAKCGYSNPQMYYPYPDYKFMNDLFSDRRLPRVGELKNNDRNFDRDRIRLFDEKKVFDTIIKEEQFPLFSNSYLMVLGPQMDPVYARFSNDRDEACRIKTLIREDALGRRYVEKHALSKTGEDHIAGIYHAYQLLSKRYEGSGLRINQCELAKDGSYVRLEYVEGVSLEQKMDEMLARDDMDGFYKLFQTYLDLIDYGNEIPVTDYDLIFSNLLIGEDDVWTVIDYEWTFPQSRETKEVAFRAVYCYLMEDEKRNKLNLDYIIELLGITPAEAEAVRREEAEFQKKVTGKRLSLAEIRDRINHPVYTMDILEASHGADAWRKRVQIYEDTGSGFSEEQSYFLDDQEIEIQVEHGRSRLRIDPCSEYCIVKLRNLLWNGGSLLGSDHGVVTNGVLLGEGVYAFGTRDPWIEISLMGLPQELSNQLLCSMEITYLSEDMALSLCTQKKKTFWKRMKG